MGFESILLLWGIGIWNSGLQETNIPAFENIAAIEKPWKFVPQISAKAIVVMDMKSSSVIYQKNAHKRLPMASLTKMMTALVITENHQLDEIITISKGSSFTAGSSMKLKKDEQITIKNLLIGLMMKSGNDSAVALARNNSQTVYRFIEKMNTRGQELRMKNTHFSNPHGFDSDEHYSSAFDMAILTKKILQNNFIKETVALPSMTVTSIDAQTVHELKNTNQLLGSIYPVYGVKTGTTPKAGQCLALYVKQKNREYIIVILGSDDRYLDAKTLLWKIMI